MARPLHWSAFLVEFLAFPEEFLTKALIHWMPCPHSLKGRFSSLMSASSHPLLQTLLQLQSAPPEFRARKRHINFEHINFLKVGTTLGQPSGYQREKSIFPVFRGEHINFLARLTLGQPAVCPRAIWTLTRAKSLCLCAFFLPENYLNNYFRAKVGK